MPCRAENAERLLASAQESLADSRQNLASLQTHLERTELHSQASAAQASEFGAKVKDLSCDKEALVTELVKANKAAAQMKQDFKCIVKCLKGPDPLQSIAEFLEETGMDSAADSGLKARSSELTWVMRRLDDHLKQSSGAPCCSQSLLSCTANAPHIAYICSWRDLFTCGDLSLLPAVSTAVSILLVCALHMRCLRSTTHSLTPSQLCVDALQICVSSGHGQTWQLYHELCFGKLR